ncbi:MAG: helix-turn-helix transcriptional regulator [Hyphomonadaceae bacterium]
MTRHKKLPEAALVAAEDLALFRLQSEVKRAFAQSKLTQKELAERLGGEHKKAEVSRLLARPRNMTVKKAARILRAMDQLLCFETKTVQVAMGASATTTDVVPNMVGAKTIHIGGSFSITSDLPLRILPAKTLTRSA